MYEICMNGPGKNALGPAMMELLLERLAVAAGRPVLLSGTGDAFCAGLNLRELYQLDTAGVEATLRQFEAVVETLYTYPGPTVALVNGHAVAAGCVLALCCDHQVVKANPKTKIGINELSLGLRLPPITMSVVRERIPKRYLNRVLLGAELHDPNAALRLGLVDEVAEDAEAVARARLAALAAHSPVAYAGTKSELRNATVDASQNERWFHQILPTWTSPEVRKRIEAVLAK